MRTWNLETRSFSPITPSSTPPLSIPSPLSRCYPRLSVSLSVPPHLIVFVPADSIHPSSSLPPSAISISLCSHAQPGFDARAVCRLFRRGPRSLARSLAARLLLKTRFIPGGGVLKERGNAYRPRPRPSWRACPSERDTQICLFWRARNLGDFLVAD